MVNRPGRLLIVIGGPTAAGKTRVAAEVARALGTEVVSADARQFYRAMPIGTGQPTEAEMLGVRHHFIGHLNVEQAMSAQEFAQWQTMYEKEAWNPESQRLQHASVLAAVFQGASTRKDHQPWSAAHFLGADPWAPQTV